MKLVLGAHRVSYVHLKEPTAIEAGQQKKYDVTFLIDKDHPDVERIKNVIKNAYKQEENGKFKNIKMTSSKLWIPLRDGDEWLEEHPDAHEYEGKYFLRASSVSQPAVFSKEKDEIFDLDEVYSGCYCRGVIVAYAFDNKSKGVAFFLNSLMKIKDGERLGGFSASADDYDDYDDYEDSPF